VAMLDAHPDVAMSYELDPNLLDPLIGNDSNMEYFLDMMEVMFPSRGKFLAT
jgi:hypothetical protein